MSTPGPVRCAARPRAFTHSTPGIGDSATANPYSPTVLTPRTANVRTERDAHSAVGSHHDCVGIESAVAAGDAARQVGRGVRREGDDQRDHQHPVAVEVSADDQRAGGESSDGDQRGKADAERCAPSRRPACHLGRLPDGAPTFWPTPVRAARRSPAPARTWRSTSWRSAARPRRCRGRPWRPSRRGSC